MKTNILTITFALVAIYSCNTDERVLNPKELKVIHLTDGIVMTRAGIQETRLIDNQKVYTWGNIMQTSDEGNTWTTDWTKSPYIQAWELTANGTTTDANAYNILAGSTKYYPGYPLSMIAIHGNFSESFTEDDTQLPSSVTHTVETDQNTAGNYEKSDLLWWKGENITTENDPVHIEFYHKLSKIEITLSDEYYTASELDNATVTLNYVKPTITMTMSDGSLSAAGGTPVFITPRKVDATHYEAVIPPQLQPDNFISVKMNGTTVNVDAQTTFSSNERYAYNIVVKKTMDIKRNPLWYMAEYNLNTNGTFNTTASTSQGGYFTWTQAMATSLGVAANTGSYDGWVAVGKNIGGVKYHLPTRLEMLSIIPFIYNENNGGIFSAKPDPKTVFKENPCVFGYDNTTKYSNKTDNTSNTGVAYKSYWSNYTSKSGVRYAIRFIGTDYCSVWRYRSLGRGTTSARIEISARLIEKISEGETQKLSDMMTAIMSAADSYWASDETVGAVQRVMYSTGYSNKDKNRGHYWGATLQNTDLAYRFCWFDSSISGGSADLNLYPYDKDFEFTIRLFKDE